MSMIDEILHGRTNNEINDFLSKEGFKEDSWHGYECMQYVVSGGYTVWINVFESHIGTYVEYNCGGEIATYNDDFDKEDFDNFIEVYKEVLTRAKGYL
ncbi:hypothetical protein BCSAG_49610 [Bacillus cereus]